MRRCKLDLCVSTSSETMLTFEKTAVAQSSACSTIASSCRFIGYFRKPFCSRVVIYYCDVMTLVSPFAWFGQIHRRPVYDCIQERRVPRKHSDCSNAPRNPQQFDLCVLASSSCRDYAGTQERKRRPMAGFRGLQDTVPTRVSTITEL